MNIDVRNCWHWIVGIAALIANAWVGKKVKKSDRSSLLSGAGLRRKRDRVVENI